MWLARLFEDLGDLFYLLYYYTALAGVWIEDNVGWSGLANIFYDIANFFGDQFPLCYDIAVEIESWWDEITAITTYIAALFNSIDDVVAWVKAIPDEIATWGAGLIDDVVAWVKAIPDEIATWGAGLIDDVVVWIEATYIDIATWVTGHAADIYNAIADYITDIATWVTEHTADLWDAVQGHLVAAIGIQLALIAAPINLVNLWFNSIQGFFNDPWGWLEAQFEAWFEEHW